MEPDTYVVEREQHIHAAPAEILERIVDLRRWQTWSPWEDLDPNLQRVYEGPDSGVGAVYEWDGNRKAGKGRMQILDAAQDRVTIAVEFMKPFKSRSTSTFAVRTSPDGRGSTLTWTMTGAKTLMTKLMGIFTSMDKLMGPDFEKGLARLKADVEAG